MSGTWPASLLLVGCGNMGGAMLEGWLAGGIEPARLSVLDPALDAAPAGVTLLREAPATPAEAVLLGFKPHMLGRIAPGLGSAIDGNTVVLSVLAGVELAVLQARFPQARGVVRVMPNLAAALGKSPIALAQAGLDDQACADVFALLQPLGTPEWIEEEQFDLVTALAGSGPAFVYRFIDALAAGAQELGLDAAQAERLAIAMTEGAASLASASEHGPGELADRVASPGGVTREGMNVLDAEDALARLVHATLAAARDRSAAMAREAKAARD